MRTRIFLNDLAKVMGEKPVLKGKESSHKLLVAFTSLKGLTSLDPITPDLNLRKTG